MNSSDSVNFVSNPMNYSLRILLLDLLLAVPFLLVGVLAVWCVKEGLEQYRLFQFYRNVVCDPFGS